MIGPMVKMLKSRLSELFDVQSKKWNVKKSSMYLVVYQDSKEEVMTELRTSENKELKEVFDV